MPPLHSYLSDIAKGNLPQQISPDCEYKEQLLAIIERILSLDASLKELKSYHEQTLSEMKNIREQKRLYRSVFENAILGIMIIAKDGNIINANQTVEYMLGYPIDELLRLNLKDISLPEDQNLDIGLQEDVVEGRRVYYQIEKRYVRNDGILFWGLLTVSVIWNDYGEPVLINMIEDISARKSAELQLAQTSTHDSLTGLYNRTYYDSEFNRLQFVMLLPVSIIMIDVNGLKLVNDNQGHEAGDKLINGMASILKDSFRGDDIVARIGGDEFSALLPETGEDATKIVCERIRKCQKRYNDTNPEFPVKFAMGYATAFKGSDIPATFKIADERMYADKLQQKGTRANP